MGCIETKEKTLLSALKCECNELMSENLECLQIIQYLLLQTENLCQALRVASLHRKTENYYSIIVQCRNYWIQKAKKHSQSELNDETFISCVKEQQKELMQLKETKNTLLCIIEDLCPLWKSSFKSLQGLKDFLESCRDVVEKSSFIYGSFYMEDYKQLKIAALQFSTKIEDFDSQIYKEIKEVTVRMYQVLTKRVYYTKDIFSKPLKFKNKSESKIDYEKEDMINNLQSFEIGPNSQVDGVLERLPVGSNELERVSENMPESNQSGFESDSDQNEASFPGLSNKKNMLSVEHI